MTPFNTEITEEELGWLKVFGIPVPQGTTVKKDEPKESYKLQAGLIREEVMKRLETMRWLGERTKIGKETIKSYVNEHKIPPEEHEIVIFEFLGLPKELMYHNMKKHISSK